MKRDVRATRPLGRVAIARTLPPGARFPCRAGPACVPVPFG